MPKYHTVTDEEDDFIWGKIIENEGREFHTAKGLPFTYKIKTDAAGERLGEIIVDRKEGKTITRGTVVMAYKKAVELGVVTGPKKLGVFGASYLWPIFVELGVCRKNEEGGGDTTNRRA